MDAITTTNDGDIQMINSTAVRVHQKAVTAKGEKDRYRGRSRGGLTTKSHALVDRQGLPLRLSPSVGQAYDAPAAQTLLHRLAPRPIMLADEAYDGNAAVT